MSQQSNAGPSETRITLCPWHPSALRGGMFLPDNLSYQDVWLKPQLLTMAYVWVLQYWAEESNPPAPSEPCPLVMSVRELRQHIGRYITLSEPDIFEGLGNAIPEAEYRDMGTPLVDSTTSPVMADVEDTQLSPVETPLVDDTTVMATKPDVQTQKDLPATQGASPTKLEDTAAPTVVSVDKLAGPPTPASHMVKESQEHLQWIQVHSSQKAATVGSVPYKSWEPQWHCNCSSKWHKRVWHLLEEEWWYLGDVSGSASSEDSLEPAPWDKEGKGADPIIECLTARGTLEGAPASMDAPEVSVAPVLLMEPAVAMVISTSMGKDQRMGAACVSTVTASMEIMNLEAPSGSWLPGGYSGGTSGRRLGGGPLLNV